MKNRVMRLLMEASPNFLSGEEISRRLNVSRTAVWKHIQTLRQQGIEIEAQPHYGYRLVDQVDFLDVGWVKDHLKTKRIGHEIYHYRQITSTNTKAKELAREGARDGSIVIADQQVGGRGRFSRHWTSPPGGLWLSVIFRPEVAVQEIGKITLVAAAAIAEAIIDETGLAVGIKWPNDLLFDGKKICGILTEMSADMDRVNYLVLGIGLNVNIPPDAFPEELQQTAGSLQEFLGYRVNRNSLLLKLLSRLEQHYLELLEDNVAPSLLTWRTLNITIGRQVKVSGLKETFCGKAVGLTEDGGLILELPGGLNRVVHAGEVTLQG